MDQTWRKTKRSIASRLAALMLCLCCVCGFALPASAADASTTSSVADGVTNKQTDYDGAFTTENIGRVWTDKSVTTGNNNTFNVTLSALSSASSTITKSSVPLDIVLVLDVSGSMADPISFTDDTLFESVESKNIKTKNNPQYYVKVNNTYKAVYYYSPDRGRSYWYYWDNDRNYAVEVNISGNNAKTFYTCKETKLQSMQEAVNAFIDKTADANKAVTENNKKNEISIVKFAGNSSDSIGNYYYEGTNYSQIVTNWSTDTDSLKAQVNALTASGGTAADYGMNHAQRAFANTTGKLNRSNAKQVVIFFTDGEPNHYGDFWWDVAAATVNSAKTMKDEGTLIYTVGVFSSADPEDTTNNKFNVYMNGVSSNYPNATASSQGSGTEATGNVNLGTAQEGGAYYKAATSSSELNSIFTSIFEDIASDPVAAVTTNSDGAGVTFTDTLGQFMTAPSSFTVKYGDKNYLAAGSDGNYTANIEGHDVTIAVNNGVVTAKVPVELLPMKVYATKDGKTNLKADATPIQITYTVGLQSGVEDDLKNGTYTTSGLRDYVKAYGDANTKTVSFYSNSKPASGSNGTTTATFTPANTNGYYKPASGSYNSSADTVSKGNNNNTGTAANVAVSTKNDDGTITTALGNNGKVTCQYTPSPAHLDEDTTDKNTENLLTVSKIIDGRAWQNGDSFSFTLAAVSGTVDGKTITAKDVPMPTAEGGNAATISYVANDETHTAKFGNITYTEAGEYTYTISENAPTDSEKLPGMTYATNDSDKVAVTVTVGYKTENGKEDKTQLAVTDVSYKKGDTTLNNAAFTNEYKPDSVTIGDNQTAKIQVSKNFTGRANNAWESSDKFSFTLTAGTSTKTDGTSITTPMPEDSGKTVEISGQDGTATFGDITYETAGAYTYTLKEDLTGITANSDGKYVKNGITYDATGYTVTVTVTDDTTTGKLVANVKYNKSDENPAATVPTFSNTYSTTPVVVGPKADTKITGSKTLDGKDLKDGDFTFKLTATTDEAMAAHTSASDYKIADGANSVANTGSSFTFGDITFKKAGTYTFTMAENIPEDATSKTIGGKTRKVKDGIVYDETTYTVTVKVTDKKDGTLSAEVSYKDADGKDVTAGNVKFANQYVTEPATLTGSTYLTGTKSIDGRNLQASDKFTFTIAADTSDTNTAAAVKANQITIATGGDTATVESQTGASANFSFGNITFTKAGTYKFKITENDISPEIKGVTKDDNVCTVTVNVTDDGEGTLSANVTSRSNDKHSDTTDKAVFVNPYNPARASVNLSASKQLDGQTSVTKLAAGKFSFKLSTENGTEVETKTNEATGAVNFTALSLDKGTYTYKITEVPGETGKGMSYDSTEYYAKFEIVDDPASGSSVLKNNTITYYTMKNGAEETLTGTPTFKNTYTTTNVGLQSADKLLTVSKAISGRTEWVDTDSYTFTLAAGTSTKLDGTGSITTEMPADNGKTVTITKDTADKTATFGDITYSQEGLYNYTITESTRDTTYGVTNDTAGAWNVAVKVVDNGSGALTVDSVTYTRGTISTTDKATFTNSYSATPVSEVTIKANKTFKTTQGNKQALQDSTFSFALYDNSACTGTPKTMTVTVDSSNSTEAALSYAFTNVTAGEYTYYMKETVPEEADKLPGVIYDDSVYKVTFTVVDDGSGQLKLSSDGVQYQNTNGGTAGSTAPTFVNTYNADFEKGKNSFTPTATKTLTGRDMTEGEFSFKITKVTDNGDGMQTETLVSLGSSAAADNGKSANVTFSAIGFNMTQEEYEKLKAKAAELEKTTEETEESEDKTETTPEPSESPEPTEAAPTSAPDASATPLPSESPTATPTESATPAPSESPNPTPTEEVEGVDELHAQPEPIAYTEEAKAAQETIGAIMGDHWYKMTEVDTGKGGITYDKTEYWIKVTVTDVNGTLTISSPEYHKGSKEGETVATPGFSNTYTAQPATPVITATKTLEGRNLHDNEFAFQLKNKEGIVIAEGMNNASGQIQLQPTFEQGSEGDYIYTLTEKAGGNTHITYSEASYTVNIHVEDNGEGQMVATVTYPDQGDRVFANTYTPDAVQLQEPIKAKKVLNGRELKQNEFMFGLYLQLDGQEYLQVQDMNDADGNVSLTLQVAYPEEGTWHYVLREIPNGLDRVTYDTTSYAVTVTVTKDPDTGVLSAKATVDGVADGEVPTFTNTYTPASATPAATATPTPTATAAPTATPAPAAALPQTGDTFPYAALIAIATIAAAGFGFVLYRKKKNNEK